MSHNTSIFKQPVQKSQQHASHYLFNDLTMEVTSALDVDINMQNEVKVDTDSEMGLCSHCHNPHISRGSNLSIKVI